MYTVTIYTTGPACMACRMTKRAMDKAGITYTEVDLTTQPEAHTYLTDEQAQESRRMRRTGRSLSQIARIFGVSRTTVRRYLADPTKEEDKS